MIKNSKSQISIAIICALLGFLLTYQFKILNKNKDSTDTYNKSNIINEIDSLKKEKAELEKTNNKLSSELKQLENSASKEGEVGKQIKKELDTSRMYLGLVDVTGPGVEITITPKTALFGSNEVGGMTISDTDLVHIVNLLWYANAEAISINGYRITAQTGIKNSSNFIWIGSEGRVSPQEPIVIKAIGDKAKLNVALNFPGSLDFGAIAQYDSKVVQSDNIVINKSTQLLKNEYLKAVENKED